MYRRSLFFVLLTVLFLSLTVSQHPSAKTYEGTDHSSFAGFAQGEIIVKLKSGAMQITPRIGASGNIETGIESLDSINEECGAWEIEQEFRGSKPKTINGKSFDLSRHYILRFNPDLDIDEVLKKYEADPSVESAEPVALHYVNYTPNDPNFSNQWHFYQSSDHDIDTPDAWNDETGSDSIIIAIMDTGVRYFHKDLGGANTSIDSVDAARGNMWINWAEKNGTADYDDDQNGYVDDWIGWDFVSYVSPCWTGEDCSTTDNDPRDFNGHGTHCAGIAAAITNNGYKGSGTAGGWNSGSQSEYGNGAKVMALRIGWSAPNEYNNERGYISTYYAAQAFYYAADNGAKIASCSWGSSNTGGLGSAVDYFLASGGLIFKAAGNDDDEIADYMCGRSDVISVAATNSSDNKASFSSYGTWVDICAPGQDIYSTHHDHSNPSVDGFVAMSGTSMATPMAAGTAALIWSCYAPESSSVVQSTLFSTADDIDDHLSTEYIGKMGAGRINARKAADAASIAEAFFSGTPTSGTAPLTVQFTDQSIRNPQTWKWFFGDGAISYSQNPSHIYTDIGQFDVTLVVANGMVYDTLVVDDYITVTEPSVPGAPTLILPASHDTLFDFWTPYTMTWSNAQYGRYYHVQLSYYNDFTNICDEGDSLTVLHWDTPALATGIYESNYYWRVRALNDSGYGDWSTARHFWLYRSKAYLSQPSSGQHITNHDSVLMKWYGIAEGFGYRLNVDNSMTFSEPLIIDTTIYSTDFVLNYYISPPLPNATYYWRVKSYNPHFNSTSSTKYFYLESGGGASCPVLFSYDGAEFNRENVLLTACEESGYKDIVTDYYRLQKPVVPVDNKVLFQLRETEDEISYIDNLELITVDHQTDTRIGCTVNGRIFAYKDEVKPVSAFDSRGEDCTGLIIENDDLSFSTNESGHMVVVFPDASANPIIDVTPVTKSPCPFQDPKLAAESIKPTDNITVEVMDDNGNWVEQAPLPTRENAVFESSLIELPTEGDGDNISVRISWTGGYSIDAIRCYIPSDDMVQTNVYSVTDYEITPANAAMKGWYHYGDNETLALTRGDIFEFSFEPQTAAGTGLVREYILKATGRYEPDYNVYENMLPDRFVVYNNRPNPFNPSTEIKFYLPEPGHVNVDIFNILGHKVASLLDENMNAGINSVIWEGTDSHGNEVGSGVYLYRITYNGNESDTKKMMLVR